jgi:hypothetical protein
MCAMLMNDKIIKFVYSIEKVAVLMNYTLSYCLVDINQRKILNSHAQQAIKDYLL